MVSITACSITAGVAAAASGAERMPTTGRIASNQRRRNHGFTDSVSHVARLCESAIQSHLGGNSSPDASAHSRLRDGRFSARGRGLNTRAVGNGSEGQMRAADELMLLLETSAIAGI